MEGSREQGAGSRAEGEGKGKEERGKGKAEREGEKGRIRDGIVPLSARRTLLCYERESERETRKNVEG